MKKMIILGAGLLLVAGAVFLAVANKPLSAEEALLLANVEAIAQSESGVRDGALYSNQAGTKYCCGPGNVRDCDETGVPGC